MAYTDEDKIKAKEKIILEIASGKSLKSILKKNDSMPSRQTVYNWFNASHNDYDETFLDNYTRAREDSADIDAERVQEIAEGTLKGKYKPDAARTAIDAIKWAAGVKKPLKYGTKVTHSGDPDKPIVISFED